jgi:hypothetical protein
VIAVNGLGQFAPLMLIIKHPQSSEAKPDQTKRKVITELFKKEGFRAEKGWVKDIWEKILTIKGVTALHRCTYTRHTVTGHVITSQCKAGNDTTRMVTSFNQYSKTSSCGTLAVIPQGTLEVESESVADEYTTAIQEEDFERALFARYIESIDRVEEEEEEEQEESNEVIVKISIDYQIKNRDMY